VTQRRARAACGRSGSACGLPGGARTWAPFVHRQGVQSSWARRWIR